MYRKNYILAEKRLLETYRNLSVRLSREYARELDFWVIKTCNGTRLERYIPADTDINLISVARDTANSASGI